MSILPTTSSPALNLLEQSAVGTVINTIETALGIATPVSSDWSVDSFIANFDASQGIAQQNKFSAQITPPYSVLAAADMDPQSLTMQCFATSLPGIELSVSDYKHSAVYRHLPQKYAFVPLQLNFYCSGAMVEKALFDIWMSQCVNLNDGTQNYRLDSSGNPNYEGTITLVQFDASADPTYAVELKECFPISVSQMPLEWNSDQVHVLSVTFSYYKWFSTSTPYNTGATSASTLTNLVGQLISGNPTTISPIATAASIGRLL